ncbi:MAG: hypothetical protein WHT08_18220 [Bryobacteraceae bacterium]
MRDLKRELLEWDGWPESWRPEPGDVLVGTVLRYDVGHTAYGPVRTCTVRTDDGERVAIWLSSTVLLDLFKRERPQVGERIGLRYQGKHPEHGYHRYRLIVDRDEPLSFDPLGGEARVPAAAAEDDTAPF